MTMEKTTGTSCAVLILFLALSAVYGKVDETVVRTVSTRYVADGLKIRQYSDGADTVVAIFTAEDDELLECHVEKGNLALTQALFNHAVANPDMEEQFLVQMDVARLARKCRKMMRDIRRLPSPEISVTEKRTRTRMALDVLMAGTRFCARQPVDTPTPKPEGNNTSTVNDSMQRTDRVENQLDDCCHAWQTCGPVVPALGSTNGLFNPYFWPIKSCACEYSFRSCMSVVVEKGHPDQKQDAAGFISAYFHELQPKCYTVQQEQKCVDYDLWHTKCIAHEDVEVFNIVREQVVQVAERSSHDPLS